MKRFVLFAAFIVIVGFGAAQSGVLRLPDGWLSAGAGAASPQFMTAPVDGVLARLVDAARAVAELEPRSQDAELLVAIHRWNAERV